MLVCRASDFLFIANTIRKYDVCWNEIQSKTSVSEDFVKDTKRTVSKTKTAISEKEIKAMAIFQTHFAIINRFERC